MSDRTDRTKPHERVDFVEALVADLRPVAPAPDLGRALAVWALLGVGGAAAWVLVLGGPRETALADLTTPRLAVELLLGVVTLVVLARAALEVGVPGRPSRRRLLAPALLMAGLWLAVALGALPLHGPDASMAAKRAHCFLEGLAIAALPAGVGLHMIRRRSLSAGPIGGSLIGLAGGGLPALAMQLACLYDPSHALRFHFTPMLVAAGVLGLLGALRSGDD